MCGMSFTATGVRCIIFQTSQSSKIFSRRFQNRSVSWYDVAISWFSRDPHRNMAMYRDGGVKKNHAPLLYNENVIYLMWCNDLKVKWKMNVCVYELGSMSGACNISRGSQPDRRADRRPKCEVSSYWFWDWWSLVDFALPSNRDYRFPNFAATP